MELWKRENILHLNKKQNSDWGHQGERTLNEIAAEYGIHPNLLSRWKTEFISNAGRVFSKETDEVEKVKQSYEKEKDELLKQIGQLSYEVACLKKIWPPLNPEKTAWKWLIEMRRNSA